MNYLCGDKRKMGVRTYINSLCLFILRHSSKRYMGITKRTVFTFVFVVITMATMAQESQTGYNFLRLPVSAHAAAVGGDNITIIEDDEALIFNNPALLSSVSDKTIDFNFMNYMHGSNLLSVAFNRNIKDRASAAVSAQYINYGSMKRTNADNVQSGDFSAYDISLAGYFSYMLSDKLVGGITAKFITSYIDSYNSIGVGVDLGLNYYDSNRGWSLSAVVKNLGGQVKAYDENYDAMPIDVQLGVTKKLLHTPFSVSATMVDLNHLNYKFINHFVAGVDISLSQQIWVGMGYNFRRADEMKISDTEDISSHGAGFSIGGGINLERFKINLAYGKYHVSSSALIINLAYSL